MNFPEVFDDRKLASLLRLTVLQYRFVTDGQTDRYMAVGPWHIPR